MRISEFTKLSPTMETNLLKLRKGSAAWLNAKRVEEVFAVLDSGWTITKADMYMLSDAESSLPQDYHPTAPYMHVNSTFSREDGPKLQAWSAGDRDDIETYREFLLGVAVESVPEVSKKSPQAVILNVGEIVADTRKSFSDALLFPFELAVKVKGFVITSPDGKTFRVAPNTRVQGYRGAVGFDKWFAWATENTTLMQEILDVLGLEPHVKASERPREVKTGQTIGTCAICGREHVVKNNKMVLHGYQRPGVGFIVGDCFGVGYDAYEVSPQACEAYIPVLERALDASNDILKKLEADQIDSFLVRGRDGRTTVTITREDQKKFAQVRSSRISETEQEITGISTVIGDMKKQIAEWKPGELRTATSPR